MTRIASRVSQLTGEGALAVFSRAKELERQGRSIIHLELGEPDFHAAAPVVDAVRAAVAAGRDRYCSTRGVPALREAIAEYLKRTRRLDVAAEQVLVAPGCKMALSLAMMALIEPGDEVLYPDPGFPIYPSFTRGLGAIAVPFGLEEKNKFQPDINEIAQKISSRTGMIIFNSPNNPTGTVFSNAALEGITKLAVKHDLWVLSAEQDSRINFVGKNPEVVLHSKFRNSLERGVAENRAGRIIRRIENDHARTRRNLLRNFVNVRLEFVFFFQAKGNGDRTQPASKRRINWKTRIGVKHFIARLDQRHHRQGKRHLAARGDQNLLGGNVEPARAFQVLRNGFAQCRHAARGTIAISPSCYGGAHRIDDRRGSMKIRLAQFQVNDGATLPLKFFRARKNRQRAFASQLRNARCNSSHSLVRGRILSLRCRQRRLAGDGCKTKMESEEIWGTRGCECPNHPELTFPPLERVAQRELDETRVADRREDSAKGPAGQRLSRDRIARDGHHVIDRRIGEIGVVPNVEEVGCKADLVVLIDLKILDQREVPILLVRPAVDVATKVAKSRCAGIGIQEAPRLIGRRRSGEVSRLHVAVVYAVAGATAG